VVDQDRRSIVPPPAGAKLIVSWDHEVSVELAVSHMNWAKIVRGDAVTIRGKGYRYEGNFFWDYWDFSGGLDGQLVVRYGSPKDRGYSGEGFVGTPREALVEE
jgi:hypothetical protein